MQSLVTEKVTVFFHITKLFDAEIEMDAGPDMAERIKGRFVGLSSDELLQLRIAADRIVFRGKQYRIMGFMPDGNFWAAENSDLRG